MPHVLSRYLRIKEKSGQIVLFHELHPDPVYCSQDEWKGEWSIQLKETMVTKKLLISSESDDEEEYKLAETKLLQKINQPTILYLMLSERCNFDCRYCPAKFSKSKDKENLGVEDALAGVDLWLEHLRSVVDPQVEYYVIFYGGEPLLNRSVMKAVLEYFRQLQADCKLPTERINLMVTTNGALVDSDFVSLCREYDLLVAIGLDGPKAINDVCRIDQNGQSTYEQTVRAIKYLVDSGVKTFASTMILPDNLSSLSEYDKFFRELGVKKFGFNFLKGRALVELVGTDNLADYYIQSANGVIENGKKHGDYQMEKKVLAFNDQDFFPVDCTCYGNQLVVLANGQVSNCPFARDELGHVSDLPTDWRIWDSEIVKKWRERLPLYHPAFQDCDFKSLCGAGCAWGSRELTGDLLTIDESSRIFTQEVFDELIWSKH